MIWKLKITMLALLLAVTAQGIYASNVVRVKQEAKVGLLSGATAVALTGVARHFDLPGSKNAMAPIFLCIGSYGAIKYLLKHGFKQVMHEQLRELRIVAGSVLMFVPIIKGLRKLGLLDNEPLYIILSLLFTAAVCIDGPRPVEKTFMTYVVFAIVVLMPLITNKPVRAYLPSLVYLCLNRFYRIILLDNMWDAVRWYGDVRLIRRYSTLGASVNNRFDGEDLMGHTIAAACQGVLIPGMNTPDRAVHIESRVRVFNCLMEHYSIDNAHMLHRDVSFREKYSYLSEVLDALQLPPLANNHHAALRHMRDALLKLYTLKSLYDLCQKEGLNFTELQALALKQNPRMRQEQAALPSIMMKRANSALYDPKLSAEIIRFMYEQEPKKPLVVSE